MASADYPNKHPTFGERTIPLDGKTLLPVLRGDEREPHDYLYWHWATNRAVRKGDWKLVWDKHAKTWELTHRWADHVLFANFFTTVERDGARPKAFGGQERLLEGTMEDSIQFDLGEISLRVRFDHRLLLGGNLASPSIDLGRTGHPDRLTDLGAGQHHRLGETGDKIPAADLCAGLVRIREGRAGGHLECVAAKLFRRLWR